MAWHSADQLAHHPPPCPHCTQDTWRLPTPLQNGGWRAAQSAARAVRRPAGRQRRAARQHSRHTPSPEGMVGGWGAGNRGSGSSTHCSAAQLLTPHTTNVHHPPGAEGTLAPSPPPPSLGSRRALLLARQRRGRAPRGGAWARSHPPPHPHVVLLLPLLLVYWCQAGLRGAAAPSQPLPLGGATASLGRAGRG